MRDEGQIFGKAERLEAPGDLQKKRRAEVTGDDARREKNAARKRFSNFGRMTGLLERRRGAARPRAVFILLLDDQNLP